MGLFDIFKGKKEKGSAPPGPQDKGVARLGRVVGDRHAQNYDRMEALEGLAQIRSGEAAAALLKRFTFYIEPSITDQEEKEVAFRGIVACGEEAVDPVIDFCERAESLTWPLKVLKVVLPNDRYVEALLELLEGYDTDYARNVDPKLQVLNALEGEKGDEVRKEVARFLEDVSEPVRFQAVATLVSTREDAVVAPLVDLAIGEESVRIQNKVAEALASNGWLVPDDKRDDFARAIAQGGYSVDASGKVGRR